MVILYYKYILSFLWAFVISLFAIPSVINLAHKKKILDVPNNRTVHEFEIPRLGGLAIFAGFFSSVTIFSDLSRNEGMQQLLAGLVLLFFVGLKDDVWPVSAFKKFFVQVLCCGIVMFLGGIRIESFGGLFGVYDIEEGVSYLFTFLVIIGLTNAINLIDGVNGLAGVLVVVISMFLGVILVFQGSSFAIVAFSLIGAMIGFLRYNLFKARIFMGDTGSLVSGFVVSVLAVHCVQNADVRYSPVLVASIFSIPMIDTLRVMVLRTLSGVSPFAPDQRHLHHILMRCGLGHSRVVSIIGGVNTLMAFSIWELRSLDIASQLVIYAMEGLVLLGIIWVIDKRYA